MVGRNIRAHTLATGFDLHCPSRHELDLRDKVSVRRYLEALAPDLIIHAAGRVGGIKANSIFPFEFLLENLEVGTNVIACAADLGIPRLLNLASSCIYPRNINGMLTEEMILAGQLEPTNEGYALAKIAALRLCEFAAVRSIHLQYKTLVPCNLYGPHDKFDLDSAHLIPAIITKVHDAKVRNEPTVEIWGDGSARREFMYVEDLASIVLRAAVDYDRLPSVMNVGLGIDHTVLDYYQAVANVAGWQGEFTFDLTKPTGMRRKLLNVDRQTARGWNAEHTLTDGIRKTYDFYLHNRTQ